MTAYPLFQTENRVRRTYRGGRLLDRFLGKETGEISFFPEDWISSFVRANNGGELQESGISKVRFGNAEKKLDEVVDLGDFGPGRSDSGVLVKLLDASERLGIQVHPTPEFSRKHFGTDYGKTECWHILETDKEMKACIYIGFKEGITRKKWEKLFQEQDIAGMLESLHCFEVKAGDTILVTAGTPHAIGAGCFLLEIQEPSDYTMRVEKVTLAGEKLTPMQIHYGVGEENLLDCFLYEGLSRQAARERYFLTPKSKGQDERDTYLSLVSYQDTPCFALDKIMGGRVSLHPESFLSVVVLGEGKMYCGGKKFGLKKGDKLFIPYGCGEIILEDAEALLCYPPEINVIPKRM